MRSANPFIAFSRRQTEEIILSLSGKKLVSVQDGAAMGRKLVELMWVFVSVCGSDLHKSFSVCSLGQDSSVCFLMGRRRCLTNRSLQGNIVIKSEKHHRNIHKCVMIDRVPVFFSFSVCFVCSAEASRQTVKQRLTVVGALLWRIQPFPFSRWLHPVTRCIFMPRLWLFWSARVCFCACACILLSYLVQSRFTLMGTREDIWMQTLTASINNPHNRARVTSSRGSYSDLGRKTNRHK